jgi:hypothetical protein
MENGAIASHTSSLKRELSTQLRLLEPRRQTI